MSEDNLYHEIDKYGTLIRKYLDGNLKNEERKDLAEWLWKERANRYLLQSLRSGHLLKTRYEQVSKIDEVHEFKLLLRRYPKLNPRKRRMVIASRCVVAAVVLCLLTIGGWLLLPQPETTENLLSDDISKVQAILTMANGDVVVLQKGRNQISSNDIKNFELRDSIKELVYKNESDSKVVVGTYKLEVPRGGEYNLVLPDGTFVRLNSESSICFPEKFDGVYREIEISGEVYFKVAKDTERPFIVRAGEYQTEVLGTHFGMRAFPNETGRSTVLEEGRVKVSYHGQQVVLAPGEKAYLDNQRLTSCPVDIEKELAWVNGLFIFQHDRLEQVLGELSRWYDVEFLFDKEELKGYLFTGSVCRDLGVGEILSLIERMNVVKFDKKEGYFLVKINDKVKK